MSLAQCRRGVHFYPRPPRGGRRWAEWLKTSSRSNFYPRPPRGGRRLKYNVMTTTGLISIHALREEGDH